MENYFQRTRYEQPRSVIRKKCSHRKRGPGGKVDIWYRLHANRLSMSTLCNLAEKELRLCRIVLSKISYIPSANPMRSTSTG